MNNYPKKMIFKQTFLMVKMDKKVSVIVNFYNGEQYIEECIISILNQAYTNLEIILWDNFSNDKSYEIVKQFTDPRIKYFYNKIR